MNLVLETFERVLSPNGGSATRRASALGFSAHNHQQQPQIGDSHQMAIDGGRRRSGGGANILSQFTQGNSQMPMTSVGSCVTVFDPLKGCTTETVQMRRELEATDTTERAEAEMGADKTRSRSRSGARRKKSAAGNHPRKQSMVSLLFSAISSSTPSNRRRTRLPPPRQWSVPERGSLNPNTEDEPFRLVQKECSMSSSPSSSFSNQRTPSAERMSRKRLLGSQTGVIAPNDGHSQFVLFGFAVGQQTSLNRFSSDRSSSLAESHFLTQFGQIRQCPSIFRALLLRCVDPEPLYPFLHYATFSTYGKGTEMADGMNRMSVGQTEFVSFEEVIALERQMGDTFGASPPSECLSRAVHADLLGSSVHGGFIVLCFRLLDGQTGNNLQLENTWLSWTGANQIYKYSPRSWQLRRLSLLRRVPFSAVRSFPSPSSCSSSSPFAFSYVLLCEFGSILHPSNALAALDMCERLRTRNCGTVSLYQVRHRFAIPSNVPAFSSSSSSPNCHYFSSPTVPNSLSLHLSPLQIRRSGDVHRLARMGSSQEVPDSDSGVTQRRKMLLRMREKSLGWDGGRTDTAL